MNHSHHSNRTDIGQRRAKAGGEFGVNHEWYKGGQFIANTDAAKSAPPIYIPRQLTPEELAQRERWAEKARQEKGWRDARAVQFADLISMLQQADPDPFGINRGFYQSLGDQLRDHGRLSEKQAGYVVRLKLGRQTKKNIDEWDDLWYALIEQCPEIP